MGPFELLFKIGDLAFEFLETPVLVSRVACKQFTFQHRVVQFQQLRYVVPMVFNFAYIAIYSPFV